MNDEIDYRNELEDARKRATVCGRNGSEESLEVHWEICCGDVLLAEENMENQDREWENALLVREFLDAANFLEGYDEMLNNVYVAVQRMVNMVIDHPRLKLEMLKLQLTVIRRIEALCDHDLDESEDVEDELAYYQRNIAYADNGDFDKIAQNGTLKRDPIEWSLDYESVIDEANKKIYSILEGHPRGMGFCFAYWNTKAQVLKADYGIEWRSPAIMNPHVMFD